MDNMEYIKSLEKRIEWLENFINGIVLKDGENISFSNCTIHGVGLQKCNKISVDNTNIQGLGGSFMNMEMKNCTVHNCDTAKSKVKISNCNINNKD